MERYTDCLTYMSDLKDAVDDIKKATNRKDVEQADAHAKLLVQKLIMKAPYMIKEIHDEAVRRQTAITQVDAKTALGA